MPARIDKAEEVDRIVRRLEPIYSAKAPAAPPRTPNAQRPIFVYETPDGRMINAMTPRLKFPVIPAFPLSSNFDSSGAAVPYQPSVIELIPVYVRHPDGTISFETPRGYQFKLGFSGSFSFLGLLGQPPNTGKINELKSRIDKEYPRANHAFAHYGIPLP